MNFFNRLSGDTAWAIFIVGFFLAGFLEFPLVTMGAGVIFFLLSSATGHNPGKQIAGVFRSGGAGTMYSRLPPLVSMRRQSSALLVGLDTLFCVIHVHEATFTAPLLGFRLKRRLPELIRRSGLKVSDEASSLLKVKSAANFHVHISFARAGELICIIVQVEVEGMVYADRGELAGVKDLCTLWTNYQQSYTVAEQIPAEVERILFYQLNALAQLAGMAHYQKNRLPGGGRS